MSKYFTPKVEYSIDDGVTFVDLGHLRSDGSEDGSEAQSAETAAGVELYAGTDEPITVMVTDFTKEPALRTAMKDDTTQGTIQLKLTDAEGNSETLEGYSVIVQSSRQFATGNRNAFMARFKRFYI